MIVLLATLLLAQPQPEHPREPVPVPDTARPAANEHGATLGHEEVAPGAHKVIARLKSSSSSPLPATTRPGTTPTPPT